jgi:hypothetical protein
MYQCDNEGRLGKKWLWNVDRKYTFHKVNTMRWTVVLEEPPNHHYLVVCVNQLTEAESGPTIKDIACTARCICRSSLKGEAQRGLENPAPTSALCAQVRRVDYYASSQRRHCKKKVSDFPVPSRDVRENR